MSDARIRPVILMPPAIFLGGAPKCGTSAFFDLLIQTNCFQPSVPKETFFFVDSDYPLARSDANWQQHGIEAFAGFFPSRWDLHTPLLEGTTHLLFQKIVPEKIRDLDSRVVFILRDPADRIRSSFQYTQNNLGNVRSDISFAAYVDLLLEDNQTELAKHFRDSASRWVLCNEFDLSCYSVHVDRWNQALGKDRVLLLDYDLIRSDPRHCVEQLFRWASLDRAKLSLERLQPEQKNSTGGIRYTGLHHRVKKIGAMLPKSPIKQLLKNSYLRMQSRSIDWTPQDAQALDRLRKRFQSTEPSVSELIQRQNLTKLDS